MNFLWDTIRVMGGAYGAFSVVDKTEGILTLLSYRDPNFCETINAYFRAAEFLRTTNFDDNDIEQAVIGTIGDLDQPENTDTEVHQKDPYTLLLLLLSLLSAAAFFCLVPTVSC